ncbi:fatty acid desaturase family protein [Panacagrimonas sp.]|uniref:fatty acid desaturase family protein n=1 Tax=Panacagrimonas sp. TaxID=2480088 RepID=UPI003B52C2FD
MTETLRLTRTLTREEIQSCTQRSDLIGGWALLSVWIGIAAIFAVLALWPNPLTFVLAVILLGGRQLALAILAHEAAHRTLFATRALNDTVADWFAARFIWNDVARYREHHMRHHAHTGLPADPDLSLVRPFPTTRRSLIKKFWRDLSGQTGLRRMGAQLLMDTGVFKYTVAAEVERIPRGDRRWNDYGCTGLRNLGPMALAQLALVALLAAFGQAWMYSAWALAWLTTFSLYIRIRSMAEHACTEPVADALRNTRSTRAGWLARMTVAPFHVNFHREHHLLASVPWQHLPQLHRLLRQRELVEAPPGYADVLRTVGGR